LAEAGKLICVLAQFPFSFYPRPQSFDYLKLFKERMGGHPLTVEFRNRNWQRSSVFEFLKTEAIGYCVVDEPPLPQLIPFYPVATSPIGYCRLHGRNLSWFNVPSSVRYDYLYSADELRSFLAHFKELPHSVNQSISFLTTATPGQRQKTPLCWLKCLAGKSCCNFRFLHAITAPPAIFNKIY